MTETPQETTEGARIIPVPRPYYIDRAEAIRRIKAGLESRSGKTWSVTGGKGTAYGWLTIDAPPKRRIYRLHNRPGTTGKDPDDYRNGQYLPTAEPGRGYAGPIDRATLAELLGKEEVHFQGEKVPAGQDFYYEYIDRAEGRTPAKIAERNWD